MGYSLPRKLIRIIFTSSVLLLFTVIVYLDGYGRQVSGYSVSENNIRTTGENSHILSATDSTETPSIISPILRFRSGSVTVNEGDGTASIQVELVESNGGVVEVEVGFLPMSSTAILADIEGYATRTVRFSERESGGTVKTVTVAIAGDTEYEGTEIAVFELRNNTAGSIAEPRLLELIIEDDDVPDIVINEIHADPDERNGDADNNGVINSEDDEFIEFVNNENREVDLSGWTVSDGDELRHTFPSGSVVPAGGVVVLFGNDKISRTGSFGGALVQGSNESERLSLDDSGDSVEMRDNNGNIVARFSYESIANDNQSITRSRDGIGSFIKHASAGGAAGALFSPGTKIDGSAFSSQFALGIRGKEGWQLISVPTQNTSFNDLFNNFWMQGLTGSDAPNEQATILEWSEQEGGAFLKPAEMTNKLEAGKGYLVYLFEDDEFNIPGIQGGFPKIINSNNIENDSPVTVNVTASDVNKNSTMDGNEGWNLMGNPFGSDISVDAVLAALETVNQNVNAHIYIWDQTAGNGNGSYVVLSSGDTIAPFQAFWIRYTDASGVNGTVTLNRSDLVSDFGSANYKDRNAEQFNFSMSLSDGTQYDRYRLVFSNRGNVGIDRYDAFKLHSLNSRSLNLYGIVAGNKFMKQELPVDEELSLEIPLGFEAPGRSSLNLDWEGLENIPDRWKISLIDRELNREIDLRSVDNYRFSIQTVNEQADINTGDGFVEPQLNTSKQKGDTPRFILSISSAASGNLNSSEIPESVKLNPNYPNPFNPTTTISYELKEDSEVLLSIWNIVGQKVVTLVDGMKEAGEHSASWNASEMPSGIYIAQLEVGGEVFIRKMTLIK